MYFIKFGVLFQGVYFDREYFYFFIIIIFPHAILLVGQPWHLVGHCPPLPMPRSGPVD